jgi:hypothetical protein
MLQEGNRAFPSDHEPPHVGDVEKASVSAGGEVFLDDPSFVNHRHLPSREFHHLPSMFLVPMVQRGSFQVFLHD